MAGWEQALCRDELELFDNPYNAPWAKDVCVQCPCLDACRVAVREVEQRFGRQKEMVWAGLTEEERRQLWTCAPTTTYV